MPLAILSGHGAVSEQETMISIGQHKIWMLTKRGCSLCTAALNIVFHRLFKTNTEWTAVFKELICTKSSVFASSEHTPIDLDRSFKDTLDVTQASS